MIQFESVSKTFRDGTTAVADLNLTVPSHKITVIVGPSGCGKTTTLRMVNRMLEPTKGQITWDGTPLRSKRKTTLRRQMGYVIQSGGLFPHRTVLENIGTVPGLLRWDKSKIRKRAFELLGSVGLDPKLANRYPVQLSGGQQQRVGVARALAADPLVMLMDEPFSAVDPVVRGELHEFFLRLQRRLSKTIILITHDVDEAIKLGDQVAILRVGGRLAQVGTPQQLLDEPADAFVEGFIGKDRGYRSLSFVPAADLPLYSVPVVRDASAARDTPSLVVDADARPLGWTDPSRPTGLHPVGSTFDPETDTLRIALDAALTSPVSLAVAVNRASGRFAGVVSAQQILTQVAEVKGAQQESIALGAADGDQAVERDRPMADGDQAVETDRPSTADQPGVADGSAGSAAAAAGAEADVDSSSDAYAGSTGAGDGGAEERSREERDLKSSELVSSEAADATSAAAETDEQAAPRYDGSDEEIRADRDLAGNVGDQDSAESDPAPESQQGIEDATPLEESAGQSQNSDEDTIVIAGVPVEIVPGGVIDNGQGSGSTDVHERDADRAEAPVR
ncbi:MAG TPA: ABC transporter ATP-binding protein [Propionibacteriaceae bacterium]|nr:ABC transporter ATP-binding protein [Propionibacteriaceae bacterium]